MFAEHGNPLAGVFRRGAFAVPDARLWNRDARVSVAEMIEADRGDAAVH